MGVEGVRRIALALTVMMASAAIPHIDAAPVSESTDLEAYDEEGAGCYYNFQHYGEGDRIMTNEPCLNCTCHNRMLMCYLRVCPFTKPIGQDCTVEKRGDQCCPIITCPDVRVDLVDSTTISSVDSTEVGHHDKYGCSINSRFYTEGAQVPSNPEKPCELCYCIRNMTACVMQECTLHVEGCTPVYQRGVCCPVRYACDHPEDEGPLMIEDATTTTVRPTPGYVLTTTMQPGFSADCEHDDVVYPDGVPVPTEQACEHCYCMKGKIVCAVQECGTPMENEGKNCTAIAPKHGQCCPDTYICEGDVPATSSPISDISEPADELKTTTIDTRTKDEESTDIPQEVEKLPKVTERTDETTVKSVEDKTIESQTPQDEKTISITPKDEMVVTQLPEISHRFTPEQDKVEQHEDDITKDKTTDMISEDDEVQPQLPDDSWAPHTTEKTSFEKDITHVPEVSHLPKDDEVKHAETETSAPVEESTTLSPQHEGVTPIIEIERKPEQPTTEAHLDATTSKEEIHETVKYQEDSQEITDDEGKDVSTKSTIDKIPSHRDDVSAETEHPTEAEHETPKPIHDHQPSEHIEPEVTTTGSISDDDVMTLEPQTVKDVPVAMDHVTESLQPGETPKDTFESSSIPKIDQDKSDEIEHIPDQEVLTDHDQLPDNIPHSTMKPDELKTTVLVEAEHEKDDVEEHVTEPIHASSEAYPHKIDEEVITEKDETPDRFITSERPSETETKHDTFEPETTSPAEHDHHPSLEEFDGQGSGDKPAEEQLTTVKYDISVGKDIIAKPSEKPIKRVEDVPDSHEYEQDKKVTEVLADISDEFDSTEDTSVEDSSLKPTSDRKDATTSSSLEPHSSESDDHHIDTVKPDFHVEETTHVVFTESAVTSHDHEISSSQGDEEKLHQQSTTSHPLEQPSSEHDEEKIDDISKPQDHVVETTHIPFMEPTTTSILEETTPRVEDAERDDHLEGDKKQITNIEPDTTEKIDFSLFDQKPESEYDPHIHDRVSDSDSSEKVDKDILGELTEPSVQDTTATSAIEHSVGPEIAKEDITSKPQTSESTPFEEVILQEHTTSKLHDIDTSVSPLEPHKEEDETSIKPGLATEKPELHTEKSEIQTEKPEIQTEKSEFETDTPESHTTQPAVQIILEDITTVRMDISDHTEKHPTIEHVTSYPVDEAENEISEDHPQQPQEYEPPRIPGEGHCLIDGKSYLNNDLIPTTNKCQTSCRCVNSIVSCEHVKCSPPPPNLKNCQAVYHAKEACCPMYTCEHEKPEEIESGNQMSQEWDKDQTQQTDATPQITVEEPIVPSVYIPDCDSEKGCQLQTKKPLENEEQHTESATSSSVSTQTISHDTTPTEKPGVVETFSTEKAHAQETTSYSNRDIETSENYTSPVPADDKTYQSTPESGSETIDSQEITLRPVVDQDKPSDISVKATSIQPDIETESDQSTVKPKLDTTTVSVDDVNKIGVSVLPTDSVDDIEPQTPSKDCEEIGCKVEAHYTRYPLDKLPESEVTSPSAPAKCGAHGCEDDEQNIIGLDDLVKPICGPNGCVPQRGEDDKQKPETTEPEVTQKPLHFDENIATQQTVKSDDSGTPIDSTTEQMIEAVPEDDSLATTAFPPKEDNKDETCEGDSCSIESVSSTSETSSQEQTESLLPSQSSEIIPSASQKPVIYPSEEKPDQSTHRAEDEQVSTTMKPDDEQYTKPETDQSEETTPSHIRESSISEDQTELITKADESKPSETTQLHAQDVTIQPEDHTQFDVEQSTVSQGPESSSVRASTRLAPEDKFEESSSLAESTTIGISKQEDKISEQTTISSYEKPEIEFTTKHETEESQPSTLHSDDLHTVSVGFEDSAELSTQKPLEAEPEEHADDYSTIQNLEVTQPSLEIHSDSPSDDKEAHKPAIDSTTSKPTIEDEIKQTDEDIFSEDKPSEYSTQKPIDSQVTDQPASGKVTFADRLGKPEFEDHTLKVEVADAQEEDEQKTEIPVSISDQDDKVDLEMIDDKKQPVETTEIAEDDSVTEISKDKESRPVVDEVHTTASPVDEKLAPSSPYVEEVTTVKAIGKLEIDSEPEHDHREGPINGDYHTTEAVKDEETHEVTTSASEETKPIDDMIHTTAHPLPANKEHTTISMVSKSSQQSTTDVQESSTESSQESSEEDKQTIHEEIHTTVQPHLDDSSVEEKPEDSSEIELTTTKFDDHESSAPVEDMEIHTERVDVDAHRYPEPDDHKLDTTEIIPELTTDKEKTQEDKDKPEYGDDDSQKSNVPVEIPEITAQPEAESTSAPHRESTIKDQEELPSKDTIIPPHYDHRDIVPSQGDTTAESQPSITTKQEPEPTVKPESESTAEPQRESTVKPESESTAEPQRESTAETQFESTAQSHHDVTDQSLEDASLPHHEDVQTEIPAHTTVQSLSESTLQQESKLTVQPQEQFSTQSPEIQPAVEITTKHAESTPEVQTVTAEQEEETTSHPLVESNEKTPATTAQSYEETHVETTLTPDIREHLKPTITPIDELKHSDEVTTQSQVETSTQSKDESSSESHEVQEYSSEPHVDQPEGESTIQPHFDHTSQPDTTVHRDIESSTTSGHKEEQEVTSAETEMHFEDNKPTESHPHDDTSVDTHIETTALPVLHSETAVPTFEETVAPAHDVIPVEPHVETTIQPKTQSPMDVHVETVAPTHDHDETPVTTADESSTPIHDEAHIEHHDHTQKPAVDVHSTKEPSTDKDSGSLDDRFEKPEVVETTVLPEDETTVAVKQDEFVEQHLETTSQRPLESSSQAAPQSTTDYIIDYITSKIPFLEKSTPNPEATSKHTPVEEEPEVSSPDEEEEHHEPQAPEFPGSYGTTGTDNDYEEEETFGPGTCRYGGKIYVSAQQIPRDDPCDFCFCFRSDIICLQQSCPPPIQHCHEEPIQGFCCPRYECPVSMATVMNTTTTTTTTTTTLPPHFLSHAYKGQAQRRGCQIDGHVYKVGEVIKQTSGPCLHCICGADGQMKCDPKKCTPEPMLRQMIAVAATQRRRR